MRRTCLCFPSFTTIRIGLTCNDPAGNSYPMVELLGLAARDPSAVPGLLSIAHIISKSSLSTPPRKGHARIRWGARGRRIGAEGGGARVDPPRATQKNKGP